jgi:hypothetical protein
MVKITAPGGQTATYTWNGTDFNLTSGTTVQISTLAVGQQVNYTVDVDLPNGASFQGYSIPLVAYVNNDGNDVFNPTDELINNLTIDNLYTGYLKLTKEARILYVNGTTSAWFNDTAFTSPAGAFPASGKPQPSHGDRIQYRITYQNISAAAPLTGANNTVLPANNVVVIENGIGTDANAPNNNWAKDVDSNGVIDTQNVPGSGIASQGTVQFYNGNPATLGVDQAGSTAASDVTQYTNTVGTVNPGESGTFTFQRTVQ